MADVQLSTRGATIKTAYEAEANTNAYTDAEKTKLAGVATAATANATDAALRDRATHTGAQAIGTVTGLQTALDAKAPLASPALTGTPTVPTAAPGTNTTQAANTAFVTAAVAAGGGGGGNTTTTTGAGAPAGNPSALTDRYIDTTNGTEYFARGPLVTNGWQANISDGGGTITPKATPLLADEVMGFDVSGAYVSTWSEVIAALKLVALDASNRLVNPKAIYTSFNGGTPAAASTYTPAAADGNVQHITNDAAFTLAPPATLGSFVVEIVNGATAGAITTSGFTKVSGDALTTTNGHKFVAQITVSNSMSHLNIAAGQ